MPDASQVHIPGSLPNISVAVSKSSTKMRKVAKPAKTKNPPTQKLSVGSHNGHSKQMKTVGSAHSDTGKSKRAPSIRSTHHSRRGNK